jgi:hypothetical protein
MNCINPIYKLGEYLVNQISSTTTDEEFRLLLVATLNTTINGYSISKRLNPTLCCPDCPTDECNGGTYFLGNMVNMISFIMAYINDENEKLQNRICCGNMIGSYAASTQQGVAELAVLPICCNSFSKGYVDSLLLSMETWYDEDNITHSTMCTNYPYNTVIDNGIVEYSLFNGDSAINDFIETANMLPNDSFKFIFLMYVLNEGIVITCSECAQVNSTINIMTTSNFITNCLDRV